jgi:hypothetical protein
MYQDSSSSSSKNISPACKEALYERAFRTANTNIQYISRPSIVGAKDADCRLVHLSRTEICMCTLSLVQIPFKVGIFHTPTAHMI